MKVVEIVQQMGSPPAGVLASYTDQDGYTISIVGIPDAGKNASPLERFGKMYISDGKTTIRSGYWMNYPEEEWNIPEPQWQRISWTDRAAMEAKQQATAYKPLRDQFAFWVTRQHLHREGQSQLVARKWDTGQTLSPAEADLLKKMLRSEFHPAIDRRTAK